MTNSEWTERRIVLTELEIRYQVRRLIREVEAYLRKVIDEEAES